MFYSIAKLPNLHTTTTRHRNWQSIDNLTFSWSQIMINLIARTLLRQRFKFVKFEIFQFPIIIENARRINVKCYCYPRARAPYLSERSSNFYFFVNFEFHFHAVIRRWKVPAAAACENDRRRRRSAAASTSAGSGLLASCSQPRVRNNELSARMKELRSGARSYESGRMTYEPGAISRARSYEPGAMSQELWVRSCESGAMSQDPRVRS